MYLYQLCENKALTLTFNWNWKQYYMIITFEQLFIECNIFAPLTSP